MPERLDHSVYPTCEPTDGGMLDLGQGHTMYWQRCGASGGFPFLILHGGPGGSIQPYYRQLIDPTVFHGVLYDQRGCGRSTPRHSLEHNDLPRLVSDIEQLRRHLGITSWCILGGSWGSTLALAYAQAHPEVVAGLVVTGVHLAGEVDRDWWWYGARSVYPEVWIELAHFLPEGERVRLRDSFLRRVLEGTAEESEAAGLALMTYEAHLLDPFPNPDFVASLAANREATVSMARIFCHYDRNNCFLAEGQLLREASALADIPGSIVNGRLDMCTPSRSAYDLAQAWPRARLDIVAMAGHRWNDPNLSRAVVQATDRLGKLVSR